MTEGKRRKHFIFRAQRVFGLVGYPVGVFQTGDDLLHFIWPRLQEGDGQCLSKGWRAIWTGCFAEDTLHVPSYGNCWCRKALKLSTLTEGLLIIISVPLSGTNAKEYLQICRDLITLQLVPCQLFYYCTCNILTLRIYF